MSKVEENLRKNIFEDEIYQFQRVYQPSLDITHYSLPLISEHSLPVFQSKVYQFDRLLN
jgi:hypothetical protein